MPNWCDNSLSLVGPTKELKRLRQAYIDAELFEAILPCPKELKDTTADGSTNEDLVKKHGHSNWYSFATTEWGTKWDSKPDDFFLDGDNMEIYFDTAWSPPIKFYTELFERFNFEVNATFVEQGANYIGYYVNGDYQVKDFIYELLPIFTFGPKTT